MLLLHHFAAARLDVLNVSYVFEVIIVSIVLWASLAGIKKRNTVHFPFSMVWLSGFNITFIMILGFGLGVLMLSGIPETWDDQFSIFRKIIRLFTLTLAVNTLLSFILKSKKNEQA